MFSFSTFLSIALAASVKHNCNKCKIYYINTYIIMEDHDFAIFECNLAIKVI